MAAPVREARFSAPPAGRCLFTIAPSPAIASAGPLPEQAAQAAAWAPTAPTARPAPVFAEAFTTRAERSPCCSARSTTTAPAAPPAAEGKPEPARPGGPPARPGAAQAVGPCHNGPGA